RRARLRRQHARDVRPLHRRDAGLRHRPRWPRLPRGQFGHPAEGRLMRILVDMDGVIAHWGAEYDRSLDRIGVGTAHIPRTANQQQWDLNAGRTPAERKIIEQVMAEPGFYRRFEPIPGAK